MPVESRFGLMYNNLGRAASHSMHLGPPSSQPSQLARYAWWPFDLPLAIQERLWQYTFNRTLTSEASIELRLWKCCPDQSRDQQHFAGTNLCAVREAQPCLKDGVSGNHRSESLLALDGSQQSQQSHRDVSVAGDRRTGVTPAPQKRNGQVCAKIKPHPLRKRLVAPYLSALFERHEIRRKVSCAPLLPFTTLSIVRKKNSHEVKVEQTDRSNDNSGRGNPV
jgi:hypothetical protein